MGEPERPIHFHFDLGVRLHGLPFESLVAWNLGCGRCESDVAKTMLILPWRKLVSVDSYKSDLDILRSKPVAASEHEICHEDARTFGENKEAPDVIVATDVLEHFTREDGEAFLERVKNLAGRRVVIFVPCEPPGFHRINVDELNKDQDHLSHWTAADLAARGFKVEFVDSVHREGNVVFGAAWGIYEPTES